MLHQQGKSPHAWDSGLADLNRMSDSVIDLIQCLLAEIILYIAFGDDM